MQNVTVTKGLNRCKTQVHMMTIVVTSSLCYTTAGLIFVIILNGVQANDQNKLNKNN